MIQVAWVRWRDEIEEYYQGAGLERDEMRRPNRRMCRQAWEGRGWWLYFT